MPQAYTAIRDKFVSQGKPLKEAKTIAAKIYNHLKSIHPSMAKLSNKPDNK